eukprot:361875-Chlamydomonas_euryale.AAC.8
MKRGLSVRLAGDSTETDRIKLQDTEPFIVASYPGTQRIRLTVGQYKYLCMQKRHTAAKLLLSIQQSRPARTPLPLLKDSDRGSKRPAMMYYFLHMGIQ